jgi:DNA-binding LacI/PurR family transcriptional regulator
VPKDIAVVGFGDYEMGHYAAPALTSVHYDIHAMGVVAARRLCMILDEPDEQHWVVMRPTNLVVRDSS